MTIPILYEDDAILVCCKPVGVVSEPDRGRGLPELLGAQLCAAGKPDAIFGVHRLDKQVGGLMVFSRRRDVTGRLTGQIARREMEKEYLAVLRGCPEPPEGVLEDLLFHDSRCNKTFVVERPRKGVREASLSYTVLEQVDGLTLVRARLHTGRTHQIRVQFASRGLPLLGDIRYGSKAPCSPALWSHRLRFRHPAGRTLDLTCPPPEEYPWHLFSARKDMAAGRASS